MYISINTEETNAEFEKVKSKVIDICRYSYENVKRYKNKSLLSIDEDNFDTVYGIIPELSKDDLRKNFSDLLSSTYEGESFTVTTTGSTGIPTKTQWGRDEYNLSTLEVWKIRRKNGVKSKYNIIYFLDNDNGESIIKKVENNLFYLKREFTYDNIVEYTKLINGLQNVLLYGSSSTLNNFANALNNFDLPAPSVKCIELNGEMVYENEYNNIKKTFSTNIFNNYGGREMWPIALTCENGTMHVCNNLVYVTTNEYKELLITSLTKKCQPLIKYKIGDLAKICWGKCSCGKTSQIIVELIGRKNDYVYFKDGSKKHWSVISKPITEYIVKNDGKICEYSIIQKRNYDIVVNIVKDKYYDLKSQDELIGICKESCPSLNFSIATVDKIIQNHRGKRIYFMNEIQENT